MLSILILTGHLKANDVQTDILTAPYCVLCTFLFLGILRYHLNGHTIRFYPQAQKLELHSKQIAAGESVAKDSFKWSHYRISSTDSYVRVANLITLSLGVKWLRF